MYACIVALWKVAYAASSCIEWGQLLINGCSNIRALALSHNTRTHTHTHMTSNRMMEFLISLEIQFEGLGCVMHDAPHMRVKYVCNIIIIIICVVCCWSSSFTHRHVFACRLHKFGGFWCICSLCRSSFGTVGGSEKFSEFYVRTSSWYHAVAEAATTMSYCVCVCVLRTSGVELVWWWKFVTDI